MLRQHNTKQLLRNIACLLTYVGAERPLECVSLVSFFCLQVTVLNAKGAVLKPPVAMSTAAAAGSGQQQQQQALLHPPGLTGAYLEVLDQGLAAALPLNPGASASLPVTVVVGKPPGSMYDASTVQVCAPEQITHTAFGMF
jgi:hypothetical protein